MKKFSKLLLLVFAFSMTAGNTILCLKNSEQNIVQTNDAIANYRENLYTPSFLIQQLDFDNN